MSVANEKKRLYMSDVGLHISFMLQNEQFQYYSHWHVIEEVTRLAETEISCMQNLRN